MAQNFRRYVARQVGTSATTLFTADSFDTIVGIALANITDSEIKVDVILNDADSSNDVYLIKNAPIIDYKNVSLLRKYVSDNGKIISTKISSISYSKQKKLTREIKKAKILGLL